nr:centrosomal protein of 44 kDa isoform X1 [Syngnathus scovelli]XP_049577521.1 centrosomal protein of 44 kDa isoform X1 [Syngnathus scovelli]
MTQISFVQVITSNKWNQCEMTKIKMWFDWNKLSLNVSKTKFMVFGKANIKIRIEIDGTEIERVQENKFLGVIIDDGLSWKPHIKNVKSKISRSMAVIYKAKELLDYHSLRTLYCSLVLPYLHYCAEVWGNTSKTSLQPLIILQKRAIRTIHKVNYLEHTNPLFIQSKLLKFTDIVSYQTAIIMYRPKAKQLPENIQNLFRNREGGYKLSLYFVCLYGLICGTLECYLFCFFFFVLNVQNKDINQSYINYISNNYNIKNNFIKPSVSLQINESIDQILRPLCKQRCVCSVLLTSDSSSVAVQIIPQAQITINYISNNYNIKTILSNHLCHSKSLNPSIEFFVLYVNNGACAERH